MAGMTFQGLQQRHIYSQKQKNVMLVYNNILLRKKTLLILFKKSYDVNW